MFQHQFLIVVPLSAICLLIQMVTWTGRAETLTITTEVGNELELEAEPGDPDLFQKVDSEKETLYMLEPAIQQFTVTPTPASGWQLTDDDPNPDSIPEGFIANSVQEGSSGQVLAMNKTLLTIIAKFETKPHPNHDSKEDITGYIKTPQLDFFFVNPGEDEIGKDETDSDGGLAGFFEDSDSIIEDYDESDFIYPFEVAAIVPVEVAGQYSLDWDTDKFGVYVDEAAETLVESDEKFDADTARTFYLVFKTASGSQDDAEIRLTYYDQDENEHADLEKLRFTVPKVEFKPRSESDRIGVDPPQPDASAPYKDEDNEPYWISIIKDSSNSLMRVTLEPTEVGESIWLVADSGLSVDEPASGILENEETTDIEIKGTEVNTGGASVFAKIEGADPPIAQLKAMVLEQQEIEVTFYLIQDPDSEGTHFDGSESIDISAMIAHANLVFAPAGVSVSSSSNELGDPLEISYDIADEDGAVNGQLDIDENNYAEFDKLDENGSSQLTGQIAVALVKSTNGADGIARQGGRLIAMPYDDDAAPAIFAHELGHNLGLSTQYSDDDRNHDHGAPSGLGSVMKAAIDMSDTWLRHEDWETANLRAEGLAE